MNGERWEEMTNAGEEILSPRWNFAIKLPSTNSREVIYHVKADCLGTARAQIVAGAPGKMLIANETK
jgi:hypothetical protein